MARGGAPAAAGGAAQPAGEVSPILAAETAELLREAKVALNPGVPFGAAPHTHARLNFGTTTRLLEQGLEQIAAAVNARAAGG